MTELENKQAQLEKLGRQYDDISSTMFGAEVTQEHLFAFSRRLDALAPRINRLIREITELGGTPCRTLVTLNNPQIKVSPLLDLFASGALDPAELYRPTRKQKQRVSDAGRMCSLGGGLE